MKIKMKQNKEITYNNIITKMDSLLDTMFIKRFCLPVNTNMDKYENGEENINSCVCGPSNHIACVLKGKDR
jgi:hypothetical protein